MNSVGAALANGIEDGLGIEVTLGSGLTTKGISLVGKAYVKCIAIKFGIHRYRGDPHLSGGTDHADCDLSAVGNQDLRKGFSRHK